MTVDRFRRIGAVRGPSQPTERHSTTRCDANKQRVLPLASAGLGAVIRRPAWSPRKWTRSCRLGRHSARPFGGGRASTPGGALSTAQMAQWIYEHLRLAITRVSPRLCKLCASRLLVRRTVQEITTITVTSQSRSAAGFSRLPHARGVCEDRPGRDHEGAPNPSTLEPGR
jgi:hypothetical protein